MAHFPTPEETTAEDYARLGLMSGLEVHQQLATDKKLFCRCPAHLFTTSYDAEVLRHMRPTLSEMGEYDGTALMEFKTRKDIVYQISRQNVCTYELDDAPPFEINDQALEYALQISLMFGCSIAGEVHIARKQYLDGSIPTGFQRTAIVGLDGALPFRGRTVRVQQISIEEDSCREVSDHGHTRIYNTSRLGIPLIEVVTKPDMRTPEEVAAVAQEIRKQTRASRCAAAGMGASRQDVNVSVRGGTRIEIKGVPRISRIPGLVHYEALRQRALLDIRDALLASGLRPDTFQPTVVDLTPAAAALRFDAIRARIEAGGRLGAVRLPGFVDALNTPTAPGRTLLSELSDQVRVVACIDTLPNLLLHPAEQSPLPQAIWTRLRVAAGALEDEALVLVWGAPRDVETATTEIVDRCRQALVGVPEETRQARADGTTGFERVLPGADRMYPDTDLPPSLVSDERVEAAQGRVPPASWEQEAALRDAGVPAFQIPEIVMDGGWQVAREALALPGVDGVRVGEVLVDRCRRLWREGVLDWGVRGLVLPSPQRLLPVFRAVAEGRLAREALNEVIRRVVSADPDDIPGIIDAWARPSAEALEGAVLEALADPPPRSTDPDAQRRYRIGRVRQRLGLRARGADIIASLDAHSEVTDA